MPVRSLLAAAWIAALAVACADAQNEPSAPPAGVPQPPRQVAAEAGVRSATVSWSPPASDGGSPILLYTVEANPGVASQSTAETSIHFVGLENGTTYSFTVRATNEVGTSEASESSNGISTPNLPSAPTNVRATEGNRSAAVSWDAPASDGGRPIAGYAVSVDPAVAGAQIASTGETATVTGLTNGESYVFRVRAITEVGEGPSSDASNAIVPSGADEPLPAGTYEMVIRVAADDALAAPIGGVTVELALPGGVTAATSDSTTGELAPGVLEAGSAVQGIQVSAGRFSTASQALTMVLAVAPESVWSGELAKLRLDVAPGAAVTAEELRGSLATFRAVGLNPASRSTVDLTSGIHMSMQVAGR